MSWDHVEWRRQVWRRIFLDAANAAAPGPGLMPAELPEPDHQAAMPAPLAPEPMPAEPEVPVLESRALIHGCAYCGAQAGERCKTSSGRLVPRGGAHGARWQAAGGRQA